jgi:hypothetical protein
MDELEEERLAVWADLNFQEMEVDLNFSGYFQNSFSQQNLLSNNC